MKQIPITDEMRAIAEKLPFRIVYSCDGKEWGGTESRVSTLGSARKNIEWFFENTSKEYASIIHKGEVLEAWSNET